MSRYAICRKCRKKWEISKTLDTAKGYICQNCDTGRGDWNRIKVEFEGIKSEIVFIGRKNYGL